MEQDVSFACGDVELEGLLSLPHTTAKIGAVVCHPHPLYGGEMRNNVVTALVEGFQRAGIATLRFNFRGVGGSTGRHDDGIAERDDVKAAVGFLIARSAAETVAIAGYSFGSMAGLQAGSDDDRVHRLIGVALPIARRDASFLDHVTKPKLFISGDRDDISPISALRELARRVPPPTSLEVISGADHFLWGSEDAVSRAATAFLTA